MKAIGNLLRNMLKTHQELDDNILGTHWAQQKFNTPTFPQQGTRSIQQEQSLCAKLIFKFDFLPNNVLCPFFHFQIIFNFSCWVDSSYPHHLDTPLSIEFFTYVPQAFNLFFLTRYQGFKVRVQGLQVNGLWGLHVFATHS